MMYDFFCIDIVGSSKDNEIQNDNIKDLLIVIRDFFIFLSTTNIDCIYK